MAPKKSHSNFFAILWLAFALSLTFTPSCEAVSLVDDFAVPCAMARFFSAVAFFCADSGSVLDRGKYSASAVSR